MFSESLKEVDWLKVNYVKVKPNGYKIFLKDYKLDKEADYLGKLQFYKQSDVFGDEVHSIHESEIEQIVRFEDHPVYDYISLFGEREHDKSKKLSLPNTETLQVIVSELMQGSLWAANVIVDMLIDQSEDDSNLSEKRQLLLDAIMNTSDTAKSLGPLLMRKS
ncbi:hypothetical protein [Paenibacillus sp. IITD108]|uniref:hypothetical protein n=1 Tax=Paenibacillus sp. IITD108 TaxID=3116649 RepID=UPI002F402F5E